MTNEPPRPTAWIVWGTLALIVAVSGFVSLAVLDNRQQAEYRKHIDTMRREYVKHRFCPSCGDTRWLGASPCKVCNPRGKLEVGEHQ